jgi:hypothetical protein
VQLELRGAAESIAAWGISAHPALKFRLAQGAGAGRDRGFPFIELRLNRCVRPRRSGRRDARGGTHRARCIRSRRRYRADESRQRGRDVGFAGVDDDRRYLERLASDLCSAIKRRIPMAPAVKAARASEKHRRAPFDRIMRAARLRRLPNSKSE